MQQHDERHRMGFKRRPLGGRRFRATVAKSLATLPLSVIGIAGFIGILFNADTLFSSDRTGVIWLYVSAAAVVGALAGQALFAFFYGGVRCPECGCRTKRSKDVVGTEITFDCDPCRIEWTTGLIRNDSD